MLQYVPTISLALEKCRVRSIGTPTRVSIPPADRLHEVVGIEGRGATQTVLELRDYLPQDGDGELRRVEAALSPRKPTRALAATGLVFGYQGQVSIVPAC